MGNYFSHCLLSGVQQVSKWDLCDLETIVWEHWQWTKTVKLQAGLGAESYYEALWSGGGLQIQIIILCGFITASDRFQLSTTAQFLWWWCNSAPKPWHPISIIAPLLRQLYAHDKVLSRAFMQSFFSPELSTEMDSSNQIYFCFKASQCVPRRHKFYKWPAKNFFLLYIILWL